MTKEPIMIDDVDVAGCQYLYFAIEDSIIDYKEYPRCSIGEAFTNNACKNSNCYYKQLKRKEQECEKLRFPMKDTNYAILTKEEFEEYDQLKKKYKTLLLEHSGCYRKEWVDEQIRIKKIYEEDRQNYWQALQEIKEIVQNRLSLVCKDCLLKQCKTCEAKQILQKCEVLKD